MSEFWDTNGAKYEPTTLLDGPTVKGYDFDKGLDYDALLTSLRDTGFQASSFGKAVEEINKMLHWRLCDEAPLENESDDLRDPEVRKKVKCTIFLSYTSNMVSCGVREVIRYLCKHKMVDCIVTTCGGIEEDLMKCFAPTYHGDFALDGLTLRAQGVNRIGNLVIANDNYCKLENWMMPILSKMLQEQKTEGIVWTPSKLIRRLGLEIDNEESIYYWCAKNNIPVFSPAITDGSIGDMLYFQTFKEEGFVLDIVQDIRAMNDIAIKAKRSGAIILGGGLIKHHVLNANMMKNGLNYCVFCNTGQEFDGSDSGARPDEAVSWGKIARGATPVKIYADASFIFPLLVAQTFAKHGSRDAHDRP